MSLNEKATRNKDGSDNERRGLQRLFSRKNGHLQSTTQQRLPLRIRSGFGRKLQQQPALPQSVMEEQIPTARSTQMLPSETTTPLRHQQPLTEKIVVGPLLEFWTADVTILLVLGAVAAIASVRYNKEWLFHLYPTTQVPWWWMAGWLVWAFHLGLTTHAFVPTTSQLLAKLLRRQKERGLVSREQRAQTRNANRQRHSVLLKVLDGKNLVFASELKDPVNETFTMLKLPPGTELQPWQLYADAACDMSRNSRLMERLLKDSRFHRIQKSQLRQQLQHSKSPFGQYAPLAPNDLDSVLGEDTIVPMFKLRGVDVFVSNDDASSDDELSTHPFFIQAGLRDVPTCILHILCSWGSIIFYYELPSWFTDWESASIIRDEDNEEVKTFKRVFVNSDDNNVYLTERVHILPLLNDGPYAAKLLAPASTDLLVPCHGVVSLSPKKVDASFDRSGRKLHPTLEITIDMMATSKLRLCASLLKRSLAKLDIDAAIIIQRPVNQQTDEYPACLFFLRLKYIDRSCCSEFPDRFALQAQQSGQSRASILAGRDLAGDLELLKDE